MDVIFSIHFSQIKNTVDSEKYVKFRFFTVGTNPTRGVISNVGWGVSEQCWMCRILNLRRVRSNGSMMDGTQDRLWAGL